MAWILCKSPALTRFADREVMGKDAKTLEFGPARKAQLPDKIARALVRKYPDGFELLEDKKSESRDSADEGGEGE